jgi:endonuclease/exonuclease/phosphatase family metal-dependent hydrolase
MVRIATWNVENLFLPGGDGPKTQADYDTKLDGLTQTILGAKVDAVAVQEIGQPEPFQDLVSRLGVGWAGVLSMLPDVHRGIRVGVISKLPISRVADDADLAEGLPPLQVDDTGTVTTRMGRGALTVELTTSAGAALTVTTIHLKSKLISYPNGRFQPRDEAERARFAAYALFLRAAEAATVRGVMDRLLDGQGQTRQAILLGDCNDEPKAATTQMLLGPSGSEFGSRGAETPDKGDAYRLFNPYPLIPADRQYSRIFEGRRELIDQILIGRALLTAVTAEETVSSAPLPSITTTPAPITTKPFSDHAMVVVTLNL